LWTTALVMAVLAIFGGVVYWPQMEVFEYLKSSTDTLTKTLIIFAAVLPLELLFGTSHRPTWPERLRNIGAMLVYFAVGGALFYAVFLEFTMQAGDEFVDMGVEGCDTAAERWRPLLW
jgi:hypothetical protein